MKTELETGTVGMDLKLTDGVSIILHGVALIPLLHCRPGESERFLFPLEILYIRPAYNLSSG